MEQVKSIFKIPCKGSRTESFNAKIKAFRAQFRGVKNVEFFLYRLTTIFA
nr:transposase [Mesonia hippocampi]